MKTNTFITLSTATANIGVLVGLVFLIFELRQNSAIALSQMTQERAFNFVNQNVVYASDKEFSKLLARVYKHYDFQSVTKEEWDQITRHEMVTRTRQRDIWFQYNKGLIDEGVYLLAINSAANSLPIWEWLKIPLGERASPGFKKAVVEKSMEGNFQGSLLRTKFLEWSKDKKSPYEI